MFTDPEKVQQLSNSNFKMVAGKVQVCMENNKPVVKGLMIAYAPWCPHCHSMENIWKNLSKKHKMYALDADENSDARSQIELEGYPSFYTVNKSGSLKPVDVDDRTESGVEKVIKKFIKDAKKRSKKRSNKKSKKRSKKRSGKKQKGGMRKLNLTVDPNATGSTNAAEMFEKTLDSKKVEAAKEIANKEKSGKWETVYDRLERQEAWP
jgi:thiol-disulfide isomerase/thioredoxin